MMGKPGRSFSGLSRLLFRANKNRHEESHLSNFKRNFLAFVLAVSPMWVCGQANEVVQRSSSPSGMIVRDSPSLPGGGSGAVLNSAAPAARGDDGNSTQGNAFQAAGKGNVQIQGNTNLKANARNLNATSVGRDNATGNAVGAIGK